MSNHTIAAGTTSHTIKAEDITLAYPTSGPNAFRAVAHRTGCKHLDRDSLRHGSVHLGTVTTLADDWFEVAPCAR